MYLTAEGSDRYKYLLEAKRKVGKWIKFYNKNRFYFSIQYIPQEIWYIGDSKALTDERKMKL